MSKVAFGCLVLLFCLAQFGCDQKQKIETPVEQPTHDAAGYLIQPEQEFLVGGEGRLFIQFKVNGSESNPFILNIVGHEILPNDDWPLAPENKPASQTVSDTGYDLFPRIDETLRPLEWFSLNSEDVSKLAEGVRKYFQWSDTALKENLTVDEKVLVSFTKQEIGYTKNFEGRFLQSTNGQTLRFSFSKPKDSSKSFINVFVSDPLPHSATLPSFCSITLDKMGVERLLSVITNLPSRRGKFVVFRDEQDKIVRQRKEAEQNDKARADQLLH
jgi:hypothetical protein